mgnify:FL=1
MIAIDVTDYGPGIPPAQQQRIFERFYRQESAENGAAPGWGLGLFFARALVEGQGGRLSVTSPIRADTQQPGTCFTITLPLAEEEPNDD